MDRRARLQSARGWLRTYRGRDVVKGYRKWYGVSTVCAIIELRMLGVAVPDQRLAQAKITEEQAARQRAARKKASFALHGSLPDSNEHFAFIAGYTPGGLPYGVSWDELEQSEVQRDGSVVLDDQTE
jgi:hypothetical protein